MTRWCATGQQPALGQSSTQSPPSRRKATARTTRTRKIPGYSPPKRRSGSRLSGTAYDLNAHLVPEDDRVRGGHRRAVDDHPDAMARLGLVSEDLLRIERLSPNSEEVPEGVFPRDAGLHMDRTRGVMRMEGSHPAHPIRHIRHRGVLIERMVLPEARVDADVRGDRRRLTVNRNCQLRIPVDGPAGRDVRIGDDDNPEHERNRQNYDPNRARN